MPSSSTIDRLGGIVIRLNRKRRAVFPDGWGDERLIDLITSTGAVTAEASDVDVVWGRKEERQGARVRRGTFTSPTASLLPVQSRAGVVELWSPPSGDTAVVVMLPAWNEEGFDRRRLLAAALVERGISALMLEAPFYGARRPAEWEAPSLQPIRTVSDFMLLGYGLVTEAIGLLRACSDIGQPGVTGYSMGGSLAALTAATAPMPVAAAPLAAAHSPEAVIFDGMLRHGVAWERIGSAERARLRTVLDAANTLRHDARPHHATAVVVGANRDGFVPPPSTAAIAHHWGADMRWVDAGHGTLLGRHRQVLVDAVVDAVEGFQATM